MFQAVSRDVTLQLRSCMYVYSYAGINFASAFAASELSASTARVVRAVLSTVCRIAFIVLLQNKVSAASPHTARGARMHVIFLSGQAFRWSLW